MALIEVYHVVADYYPVDADNNPNITEGEVCMLNANGDAVPATGGVGTFAIGIAGDTSATAGGGQTPYTAALVVNPAGSTRDTSNRVSDFFNETLASNLITIYNGGGKFHSDQYAALVYVPGDDLFSDANAQLTNVAPANADVVGLCTVAPRAYPSGVPGTDTADGSISLGDFITFILRH